MAMDVSAHMKRHGLTDEALGRAASPCEAGDYASESGKVCSGSHVDAVGKRRITVIYDERDAQRVVEIACAKGVKPSEVYRDAHDFCLAAQGA